MYESNKLPTKLLTVPFADLIITEPQKTERINTPKINNKLLLALIDSRISLLPIFLKVVRLI